MTHKNFALYFMSLVNVHTSAWIIQVGRMVRPAAFSNTRKFDKYQGYNSTESCQMDFLWLCLAGHLALFPGPTQLLSSKRWEARWGLGTRLKLTYTRTILYSGKLSREETFTNFAVLWLFTKVFSAKFGGVASFGTVKGSNLRKFSPKNHIFHQFLSLEVSCCMVITSGQNTETLTVLSCVCLSSELHTSESNSGFFIYYYICHMSFRKCK